MFARAFRCVLALASSLESLDVFSTTDRVGRCTLGKQGPEVSCIAYGTLHMHEAGSAENALNMIEAALKQGITTFDLADVYNSQPELFGQALQLRTGLRERVEVIAKMDVTAGMDCGFSGAGAYDTSAQHLDLVLDRYLNALNTSYVDVVLLHRQDYLLDLDSVEATFKRWLKEGKVRHFGASNFDRATFEALSARVPLVANEVEISPLRPQPLYDGTVSFHYGTGSGLLAWGPLGGCPWGGANRLFKVLSIDGTPRTGKIRGALTTIADSLGVTPDVAAVAWLLRHPAKIVPIIGTMNAERLVQQAQAGAVAQNMSRQQWYHIADAVGMPIN